MSRLKTLIDANIKENGNQEITGNVLNYVLNEIADEVKREGYFPDMSVGFADNLVGRGESVPAEFSFRASGGKSIKDGAARIKRIKGNSVVWNNMVDTRRYESGFAIREGVKIQQGHKYLLQRSAANSGLYLIPMVDGSEHYEMSLLTGEYAKIFTSQYTDLKDAVVYAEQYCGACIVSDLTLMFQAGNEPTTIEEYNARKPIVTDEYAFNEGEVIHCNTESIKSVGDNAWDEQWEVGTISTAGGNPIESEIMLRSKNYIKVLPSQKYHYLYSGAAKEYALIYFYDDTFRYISYYTNWLTTNHDFDFTTPSNCCYIKFVEQSAVTYNNDLMLTLVHSGWKQDTDAGYQPYWEDRLIFDQRIKEHFPDGMKKWDMVYNKNGKGYIVKGTGVVEDMSKLAWYGDSTEFYTADSIYYAGQGVMCARYTNKAGYNEQGNMYAVNGILRIYDSSYTDAASFKESLQGVPLFYQLAEPIIIEYDEQFNLDYRVADFGTEQAVSSIPSAPFSADIIYQFNAVDMIRELWLKVQELESRVAQL